MSEDDDARSGRQIKRDMAEDRTGWARYRTQMAGERSFSAWVRTGLTAVIAGLGVARLLHDLGAPHLTITLGILFIAAGAAFFILAILGYRKMHHSLRREGFGVTPLWVMALVIIFLMGGTFIALLLVLQ